ncbi:MAG: Ig domain-containing protein, partial [Bdellovibrionia bacterium]
MDFESGFEKKSTTNWCAVYRQVLLCLPIALSVSCAKVSQLAQSLDSQVLEFVTTSLTPAVAASSYTNQIVASGGFTPYVYTVVDGSLPPALTLDSATGSISGAVTGAATGTYEFDIQVVDQQGTTITKEYSIRISPALSISTSSLPVAQTSVAYVTTVVATGGSGIYTWTASGLPAGFTLSPSTGIISGSSAV